MGADISIRNSYTNYCKDANAKGCWQFEEDTQGIAVDTSGNNESLLEDGGDVITVTGKIGNAREFDDAETEQLSHADGGSTDISGADQSISYCAWVKRDTENEDDAVIAKYSTPDNERSYRMHFEDNVTGGYISCIISSDGTSGTITVAEGTSDLGTGTWGHGCCVYNDTDLRAYFNGVLEGTPAAHTAGLHNSTRKFTIGARDENGSAGASGWDGQIDEVIILDRALTATEVYDIYQNGIR